MTRKKVIFKKKRKTIKKKSIGYLNKKRKFTFRKAGSSSSDERKRKHIRRLLTKKKRILKIVDEPELKPVLPVAVKTENNPITTPSLEPVALVETEEHPITSPSLEPVALETEDHPITTPSLEPLALENVTTEEHPITTPSLEPVALVETEDHPITTPSLHEHPSISELPSLVQEKKDTFLIRPKTLKKKLITDLKSSAQEQTTMSQGKRLNESFIDIMDQLATIMLKQGEPFRAKAYQKAQETIMTYPSDITSVAQLKGLSGIGPTITEKLNEFVNTGTLKVLEREKTNPVNLLSDVYGIGPKKAKDLIEKGVTTIEQLRERQDELLNETQKVGLKYYEDILERIPREEIDSYNTLFKEAFSAVSDANSHYEIVGSYRRGAQSSGDIDVIITSASQQVFIKFVDSLVATGVILEVLSRGPTKSHVIAKLEGRTHARRVDFLYTKPNEYAFSLLYFTGSKIFNTVMRGHALKMGYSLNEHGLSLMNGKIKGELVSQQFPDEQSIFAFLNMEYKGPTERIDGRAVIVKGSEAVVKAEPVENAKEAATLVNSVVNSVVSEPILDSMAEKEEEVVVKKVVKKNRSLKKRLVLKEEPAPVMKQEDIPSYVEQFKKEGISILEQLTEGELTDMLTQARVAYFNITPIMTDNEYDILKEFMEKKFPQNNILNEVGAAIEITKNKATLPYEMASMDKIKPDSGALDSWKKKYTGPYVLSGKADGVSGLYTTEGSVPKLYTRGNGIVGQDVSHLIPYLRLPTKSGITVRGEFILSKKTFLEKYAGEFANARNLVAGIVNRITIDEKVKDLHFVTYETIQPELKPSEQMEFLKTEKFETIVNQVRSEITNESLSELLVTLREDYEYEIDGIIVTNDAVYPRQHGNPDHSFAFKMVLSDQIAEAKVIDVIWTPSKDGYLKPRVRIEPIQLSGVTIEYATGFNGAFIQQNKIGIGALIEIIRSGDVIPHIRSVTMPAEEAKMPHIPYKWTDTHVDVLLENVDTDETVREKNILGFFRGIEVVGLSNATISKLVAAGFDSVSKILKMEKADFLKVDGIQEKTATKLYEGIKEQVEKASLTSIMSASNLFGRGFSDKKIELIMETYPTILISTDSESEKTNKVAGIKGMSTKTATDFVSKMLGFLSFLEDCGLVGKLDSTSQLPSVPVDTSHPLYKKSVVMTGFRDKTIIDLLKSVGASLGSSVSKNTFVVLVKDKTEADTGKALEAVKLGVPIMTPDEFMKTYFPK